LSVAVLTTACLTANEGATLSGRVQDSTRAVIPGVTAELTAEDGRGLVAQTSTDALGKFTFSGLSKGVYSLALTAPGFRDFMLKSVEVAGAGVVSLRDLSLTICSSCDSRPVAKFFRLLPVETVAGNIGGAIAVDLGPLLGSTPPISGAEVVLFCSARGRKQPCRRTTSDSRGVFLFKAVAPGSYDLLVSRHGYYPERRLSYDVPAGLEVVYQPIHLEKCVQARCDAASRPERPMQICE
jgi:hypothetical protein